MDIENMTFDLLKKAIAEYGDAVTPLVGLKGIKTWEECYVIEGKYLVLYFNTIGGSTRTVRELIEKE